MKTALLAILAATIVCPILRADHHNESLDLTGVWRATASTDQGEKQVVWTFKHDGGKLKGMSLDLDTNEERELDRIAVKGQNVTPGDRRRTRW